ncbi:hypothetical protein [Halorubrum sp. DTA46]|uniref:hypothetical protein n=1 Tax=Halorubrum sp. DTA46 TaxID=3402162 RepID=UPI003AB05739
MYRRALLATTAATIAAGCTGVGGSSEGSDGDDAGAGGRNGAGKQSDVDPTADPDLRSTDIVSVDAASVDETAVEFTPNEVHVAGTLVGETGCHGVAVSDATTEDGTFRVVVAAVDDAEPEQLCTQALTEVGYELDATFGDGVPQSVTVVHDDAHGVETAASAEPVGGSSE